MALREIFARFGVEVEGQHKVDALDHSATHVAGSLEHAGEKATHAEGLFKSLGEALEGVAAVFAGSELLHGIGEVASELVDLGHLSEQTGIAAKELEFYGYVVEQNDGSTQEFNNSLTILQRSLGRTEAATSPQSESLTKLGIATKNAAGETRGMNEILPDIFQKFGELKNPTDEARVASDLFGRSGVRLIPILRKGAQGLEEYRQQFEELGAPGEEEIKRAQEYERGVKRLGKAFNELKQGFVVGLLPSLTKAADYLQHGTSKLREWLENTTLASHTTAALALAIGGPLLKALAPFLKAGLKFAAIYLAFDDLLSFLEGKDSVIGRLLNAAFGDGTADGVRAWVTDAENAFLDFVHSADATADALTNANSSWTEKALALVVGFFRDASQGFPAFRAGFAATLDGMYADIVGFVARGLDAWNDFVSKIKIPPALAAALMLIPGGAGVVAAAGAASNATVDTAGLHSAEAQARQAAADRAAESAAALRGRNSNVFGTAAGGDAARQLLAEDTQIGKGPRTAKVDLAGGAAAGAAGQAQAQVATLAALKSSGVVQGATLNDNKQISITFQAGTSKEDQSAIKGLIGDVIKSDNRVALQQLTARGAKK